MQKKLIVILGPTGVGKTELAISVAEHFHVPIINADSRQIFAELPIGTAAPTPEQRRRVTHFFVGNHHISDYYSASRFEADVLDLLSRLFHHPQEAAGNHAGSPYDIALLSGGSMMYIDAVCNGIDDIPTIDETTRAAMKHRLEAEGLAALTEELRRLDPEYWAIADRKNPRRVVHALEICKMTGRTYTSFRRKETRPRPFDIVKVGLWRERGEMYERINARVLSMMEQGLEEEARRVYPFRTLNALNTVGYRELFSWFDGSIDKDEAIRQIQSNTRRYMRKQVTWFKHDDSIKWFHPDDKENIIKYLEEKIRETR